MCPKPSRWQSRIYFELQFVQKAPACCHLTVGSRGLLQTPALPTWYHTYNTWTKASSLQHHRSSTNASCLRSEHCPRLQTLHPAHRPAWSSLPRPGPGIQRNIIKQTIPLLFIPTVFIWTLGDILSPLILSVSEEPQTSQCLWKWNYPDVFADVTNGWPV